jgi:hypothetical protein
LADLRGSMAIAPEQRQLHRAEIETMIRHAG